MTGYYDACGGKYYARTAGFDPKPLCSMYMDGVAGTRGGNFSGHKTLDIGAGSCRDSKFLISQGFFVVSLDLSHTLLRLALNSPVAASGSGTLNPVCAGFDRLPFKNEVFDGAFAQASILHAPKTSAPGIFLEVARVVKSGGVFFLSLKEGSGESFDEEGRFFSYYVSGEPDDAFGAAGFSIYKFKRESSADSRDITWLNYLLIKK